MTDDPPLVSNYWTAAMFFKHENGSYKRVPIMQNSALPNGINGGMTIYYTQKDFNSNGNEKITAFPKVCLTSSGHSVECTHADSSPGLPHDSWQSSDRLPRCREEARRSALCLSIRQEHALPRIARLPTQGVQGRDHDRSPLCAYPPTYLSPCK